MSILTNNWSTTFDKGNKKIHCVGGDLVELTYGEFQHWYYFGRHAVDDNNNNRQGHLPFEEAYCSKRWDLQQLGFIIALAQTNALLAYNLFLHHKQGLPPFLKAEFQRSLARELVYNLELQAAVETQNGGMRLRTNTRSRQLPEGCSWASKTSKIARGGHELVQIDKYRGCWNERKFTKICMEYSIVMIITKSLRT